MSNKKNKIKTFVRLLFGIYTANDYIRLGRYLAEGGYEQVCKKEI